KFTACLEEIKTWMKHNFLQLNSSKTEAILVGTSHKVQSSSITGITISCQDIPFSTTVTNLDVRSDPQLTFEPHLLHIPVRINHLSCRICGKLFENPATILCGHNFCMGCIKGHWGEGQRDLSCPECGKIFPSRPNLIKNTTLTDMLRDTKRSSSRKRKSQESAESLRDQRTEELRTMQTRLRERLQEQQKQQENMKKKFKQIEVRKPCCFIVFTRSQLIRDTNPVLLDACELSLDPATAHKDLIISDNDKEVKLSPRGCQIPSACFPERFNSRRQVLCREGLQAERCYYEVEVKGGKAEIALAYKGLDRKSSTEKSAFGANEKSWSLDLSNSYSVSHKSESILLKQSPSSKKIGVYLEFKEGSLSFFEVSDSMTFLYKLKANFTEPLYPGFWLDDKSCIRISPPAESCRPQL
uniref:RING-type domain-containing protein n=1 Tax=Cyprinodon variegatus TaxID=28743 RepID=A0A3Q2DQL4_CYPVA